MAPRRSGALGEGHCPSLKLIFEKGPLTGTTREFKPSATVRIGRIARGNTIAVKDAGCSSKHLLFQAEPAASDRNGPRWTVSDLESSNGTILNDVQLEPFESIILSHGDVIKIGEETSIRVEMVTEADNEVSSGVRRNTRRRVRDQVVDLVVIDEDAGLGLQQSDDEEKVKVGVKKGGDVNIRSTRRATKIENLAEDSNFEENKDLGPSGYIGSRGVNTRRTRSTRKEADVQEIRVDLSVIEGKKKTRGGRGRKKLFAETISEETEKEETNLEVKACEEEKDRSEGGVDEPGIKANQSAAEGAAAATTTSSAGVQERNVEADKEKIVVDVEKMSLGEWLDFLEEYEPQEIIAETEEMLSEMRQKAVRCHEYMLEQKKAQRS